MLGERSKYIGPQRFLSLLFAYLDLTLIYTADAGRWTQAIKWLRDQYDGWYPDLLGDLGFITRPGAYPYSREVSEFLTFLRFGNAVEVVRLGATAHLRIQGLAQKSILGSLGERIDEGTRSTIRQLAQVLLESPEPRGYLVLTE